MFVNMSGVTWTVTVNEQTYTVWLPAAICWLRRDTLEIFNRACLWFVYCTRLIKTYLLHGQESHWIGLFQMNCALPQEGCQCYAKNLVVFSLEIQTEETCLLERVWIFGACVDFPWNLEWKQNPHKSRVNLC